MKHVSGPTCSNDAVSLYDLSHKQKGKETEEEKKKKLRASTSFPLKDPIITVKIFEQSSVSLGSHGERIVSQQ